MSDHDPKPRNLGRDVAIALVILAAAIVLLLAVQNR